MECARSLCKGIQHTLKRLVIMAVDKQVSQHNWHGEVGYFPFGIPESKFPFAETECFFLVAFLQFNENAFNFTPEMLS